MILDLTRTDSVLFTQEHAGIGDVLMTRYLFEAASRAYPGRKLAFACPQARMPLVADHPHIDILMDVRSPFAVPERWPLRHDLSVIYGGGEFSCYRDINPVEFMALRCGLDLGPHPSAHLRLSEAERTLGKELLGDHDVVVAPASSTAKRNLSRDQVEGLLKGLRKRGHRPVLLHDAPLGQDLQITPGDLREWLAVIAAAAYVVSVETSAHHAAGVCGTPSLALYSWCDGHKYSRYYDRCVVLGHRGRAVEPAMRAVPVGEILAAFDTLEDAYP